MNITIIGLVILGILYSYFSPSIVITSERQLLLFYNNFSKGFLVRKFKILIK